MNSELNKFGNKLLNRIRNLSEIEINIHNPAEQLKYLSEQKNDIYGQLYFAGYSMKQCRRFLDPIDVLFDKILIYAPSFE